MRKAENGGGLRYRFHGHPRRPASSSCDQNGASIGSNSNSAAKQVATTQGNPPQEVTEDRKPFQKLQLPVADTVSFAPAQAPSAVPPQIASGFLPPMIPSTPQSCGGLLNNSSSAAFGGGLTRLVSLSLAERGQQQQQFGGGLLSSSVIASGIGRAGVQ
jgi:hypothetical protein